MRLYRENWKTLLGQSVESPDTLAAFLDIDTPGIRNVTDVYPMRINPYFLDRARQKGESLLRQVLPDPIELQDTAGLEDPLAEERDSPVANVTHRYPDRVLFLVSDICGVYCRFCTRKRRVGHGTGVPDSVIEEGIRYIDAHPAIKDVLISGGDPFLLPDRRLDWILGQVHAIPHVEMIRIGTRVPSVLPQRITSALIKVLKKYSPIYINTHFNHPEEFSEEGVRALALLVDAGIPVGNQAVLLRGINDDPEIIARLMR